ncbi:MAG: hypothetical protein ABL958_13990 [Bdellovibrionia bacterium]
MFESSTGKMNLGIAKIALALMAMTLPVSALGDQCDPHWLLNQLDTSLNTPKPYLNNIDTAYTENYFILDPRVKLVLKGSIPKVRFFSITTANAEIPNIGKSIRSGYLFDYQLIMDAGSINPMIPGNPVNSTRTDFTLELLPPPKSATSSAPNVIHLADTTPIQTILVRYYSPDVGLSITPDILPTIYSEFVEDGSPAPCPYFLSPPTITNVPLPPSYGSPDPSTKVTFTEYSSAGGGSNAAAPFYLAARNSMKSGQVAVIRLKSPHFINTRSGTGLFPDPNTYDMRYWSLNVGDPTISNTVGGLPDYLAKLDARGYVTLVVSRDSSGQIQTAAASRGQNFIPDRRNPRATSMLFMYRNLLVSPSFLETDPKNPNLKIYPPEYLPIGVICEAADYLADKCNLD